MGEYMRNLIKTLSMLIFGSIFFLSCEIGLGASVDTEAPNLEIQNPSPDAIIRGAFKIGGTWSDDGKIETVTVKLTRTDGKGKEIEYQATFAESNNDSPNTWNCIINPLDSANIVLDGNYVAQVDITDTGKHTTTKTVQFAIDNTAPIIVLQRPSTKNDAQQVDSYGQKFTLEGQAADDNNVSLIEVQIFADKECTTLLHTVPLSNVPNSINLDVAEFKENIETDYSKIYGSTQKMGQKNFYCKVVAYDGAVYYPYDRTQTPEDLKGNKTNIYYLYEDIATAVLGEVKITDVYHILSGVYGLEKNSTRSAESNSLITKVKATLEKNVVNTGSFSLNPANNPTFSVSGKEPLKKDEKGNVNFAGGNYDITNGSQVIMEVTPGLDNIPLDGSSLKVYCIECDATGTAKSNAIKVYPVTEMKKSGTTYKYTLSVKKQDGLVIGRNYLFGVEGYDEKKNSVVCSDNNGYGFHFTTSGAAPVLTILEPEAGSVTLSQGKKLKISGTTKVEAGTPVITIIDNKEVKKTLTFNESEATEDNDKQLIYNFSTEIEFAGESAYHELEIISDIEGIKTSRTKTVSYDSEKPVISINSVSPIVEQKDGNGTKTQCLNGEVKITFSLTDDFSFIDTTTNKPYFELWQDKEKKDTATFTSTNSAVTETVTVDTKKLKDKTPVEIRVFAWDRAGNKAELSDKQYQIDQSTDKPVITPKSNINFNLKTEEDIRNAKNNENKISVGGTASFTVSDDDGIDYIAVYSQTKDASGKITETLYSRYPNSGSSKETQTPYSFILPSTSGYYSYRLEVKDIITTNADDNNKQVYQFMIKATSPAPTIELQSAEVASENNSDINDGYIGVSGSFTNTITIESIESPFILLEKIDSGKYTKVEDIELKNNNEGKYCFERTVSPTITTTYYYKVEDSNGQSSNEKSVKCKVDNSEPELGAITLPGKADTRTNQFTFRSTAKDPDSGIKIVEMYFSNDGQNYVGPIAAEGTENWYYILNFKQPVESLKDIFAVNYGEKYVKIKATDKVGLSKETEPQKFFYDTADPTVSITDYALGPSEDYQTYTQGNLKIKESFKLKGKVWDDWEVTEATLTQNYTPNEGDKDHSANTKTWNLQPAANGDWVMENLPRSYTEENKAALDTGTYEYKLEVTDKAGNKGTANLTAIVDTTQPKITIGDPTDLNTERFIPTKNFTITGTIEETNLSTAVAKLLKTGESNPTESGTLSVNSDGSFSWKVYDVGEGTYKIQVYAEDEFGNNDTITGIEFTVDATAPTTTLTPGTSTVYNKEGTAVTKLENGSTYYVKGSYALSGTITETNLSSIKVGEEPLTVNDGNTWNKEIIPDRETVTTQTITLEDKAGNKTVYTLYIAKDVSAPLLTVTSPTTGLNAASFKVEGQVTDLGIGVASVSYELYKVEGENKTKVVDTQTQNNVAGSFKFPQDENTYIDLTGEGKGEGKYIIKVTAQDKLNNTTAATPINIVNDGTPPTISSATIKNDPIRNDYTVGTGESAVTYKVYGTDTFDIEVTATDLISGVNTVTAESGTTKVELTAEKDSNGKETGKYKGQITAKLVDNVTAITIKAIDKSNNLITQDIKNIMVDKVAPAISELTYPSEAQKDKFTVSVNVTDLVALAEQNPVILKYKKNETDKDYVTASMKSSGDVYKIELTPGSGTDSDSVHYIPDGTHTFTIVATDKAGNTSEKSFEVVTDTTAPSWSTSPAISSTLAYEQKIKNENGTETETRNYYKSNLINVNVKAQDVTSGVKEILYKLDSGDSWTPNGNSNITLDNLSDGMHTVSIKAVDYAGNSTSETLIIFYIDTKSPLKPTLVSIDSESGEALQDYENESKSKLVNGQKDVTFVLKAEDASSKVNGAQGSEPEYRSGIKAVNVVKIGSTSYPVEGKTIIAGTLIENSDGQYTVTIPKEKLATGSVTVRITDNVGNTYEGTVFNMQLDNTKPILKITSPAAGSTVNKTITISGATTDNNAVSNTVVTVKKGETEVVSKTFTAGNSNELPWTLNFDTFVEEITKTETTAKLTITVSATDKAGNTASETRTITVDQDSDRPKISFNNVTLGASMGGSSDSDYIWLKNTTVLYGTVEDDDGISSMQISKDGENWKPVTLNPAKTSWSFDVKNFITSETDEEKENAANGAHTIYFKVTDAKEQEFVSATSSSLSSVYLVDGENKYGTIGSSSAKTDSVLYVKVDTLAPEVVLAGARIGNLGEFSTSYSNMTLGGSQRTMQFKLTAKDSNGIESITGTAEFDGTSVKLLSPTEVKAYKIDDTETTVGASDVDHYIVSFTVDLASAQSGLDGKDGRISLKFTGKDKAGNSSAQTATINYDYKKPVVTITSPKDSSWVSGIVTAYGTIDSASTMYYALSPSNTITPAEADTVITGGNITGQAESGTGNSHQVTSWSGTNPENGASVDGTGTIDVTPKYSQIKGNGVQWFVYFDNQPSTDVATHDVEFKKYLTNYGITTDAAISDKNNPFTTIVNLYLWIKSIDSAGNITETNFPILIDPQGDAPQVEISYPAKSGETLGGAVTLLGTASDTIGSNIGIKNVWVQIMSGKSDTNATPTKADVNLWINKGYSVYTDIKNDTPTPVTTEIGENATPANYYIQATVSGTSWSLKINAKDEFSPSEGQTKHVAYRVYAQDNDKNLSKPQTQYCIFDADNPVLSDLYLRQYSDNNNGTGTITASRPYEDDMWIKDDWWLCGTVKDTQGIASLTVNDVEQTVSGGEGHEETFKYKISTNGQQAGNIPITIVATDKATGTTHTTKKECSINFDNKKPDSSAPVIASDKIQNTNGFFTFSAEVTEDAVSGAAQSGFKYLAFYFTRGNNVYDIMRPKADGKSAVNKSDTSKFATEDGLIWKKLSVTRTEDNLSVITLTTADDNIHTGGLCKIGGSIYMIKNVNGTTIELDGSPEKPVGVDTQDALFAIANVVNNNIESGNGTKSTNDNYYGYFESISNDDGDHMVESVLKTGTTWKWEANINSRNIPDGTVTLHYVAFDAAGNYSANEIPNLQIANNAPRLASLTVWSDYNGNGNQDENEFNTKYYSKKTVVINKQSQTKSKDLTSDLLLSGNDKDDSTGGSAFMTIKAETKLIPELVGGNGNLYYTYRTKPNKEGEWSGITKSDGWSATGNDDGIDDEADHDGYYKVDDENTAYISGTMYDGKNGKNPIVITTGMLEKLNNNTGNDNPTWFEYVIYDSTEGCTSWDDVNNYATGRLSAKFKVALNVQYNDEVAPKVAIRPFYWNSRTENSVVWDNNSGKPLGHIELESDLTDEIKNSTLGNDPKVSGKIKIEGYAFDNIKLKELYVTFAGHKDISSKVLAATYGTNGIWQKSTAATNNGNTWDFEANDVFNNSEGHLVYWTLTVDTQSVSSANVARLDQTVKVVAKDERGKQGTTTGGLESATSGTQASQKMLWKDVKSSSGAYTMFYTDVNCQTNVNSATTDDTQVYLKEKWEYQMDIVPYVTGVKTSLSNLDRRTPSKFDRTALGHYPVRIVTKTQSGSTGDAETVTFEGFNLGSKTTLTVNELSTEEDSTTGGKSAKYVPDVNGIYAINNMNNNNAKGSYNGTINDESSYAEKNNYAYNRQPNNANNNLLTDDIIFDVWEFNSAAAVPISGKIEQPVMKIRPTDGKIGFAFVNGPLYFSMGGSSTTEDYSYQYWMGSYDFFTSVGFTYDDAGNSWGVAAGGDINASHADKFVLMGSKWGVGGYHKDGTYHGINSKRLESIGMKGTKTNTTDTTENFDKQRIRSPSLASTVHSGYTNLYMAYYDTMNDELRFKAGRETEQTAQSYVFRVIRCDTPDSNYAGAWVEPPNNNTSLLANGDTIYLCDENGNVTDTTAYTLTGYYPDSFGTTGQVAFTAKLGDLVCKPFPGTEALKYRENGNFHVFDQGESAYIKVVKSAKSFTGGSFTDYDTTPAPYVYRNGTVSIVAGDGVANYGAGEYVSLAAIPGSDVNNDKVVITWYDTNARTLYYSCNTTPLTNRNGTYNAANGTTGWSTPVAVFSTTDYYYAGEYCKIAVDKNGGIHIAAYDPVNLDLVYAYASGYNESFTTCVVDSNGVVGSNLTLDVALDNGKAVPFIGYYATSCIKPKYARLVEDLGNGSEQEEVTGKWEISVVPTSSIIEMQSNQHNDINIGVWKNSGAITNSTTGESSTNNQSSSYSSVSNGQIYGNGTKNPVLGYAIKYGSSSDTIETAQMK